MPRHPPIAETRSAERRAFELYLRTGRRLDRPIEAERKFNPYHDPRNGQFTFAPGGPRSLADPIFSNERGLWKPKPGLSSAIPGDPNDSQSAVPRVPLPTRTGAMDARAAARQLDQYRPNRRARIGSNGGPPLNDLQAITQAIPALRDSPVGSILAVPAEILDFTGPAQGAIGALHQGLVKSLIEQIKAIDPTYRYESLGPPQTLQGQINEINSLRFDRAVALYRMRNDAEALQLEVLRFIQTRVDAAYERGAALYEAGELPRGLSRNNSIGNFIDMNVRRDLQARLGSSGFDYRAGSVRVIGRQYDTSGREATYVVPDARVEYGDYDWTMEAKQPGKRQIRGFFNSDLRPRWTAIVRPSQLGVGHTYFITNPRQ